MWIKHPGFMDLVCVTWLTPVKDSLVVVVIGIFKDLKQVLKVWNREIFGNLDNSIDGAYVALVEIQKWYDKDSFYEKLLKLESNAHTNLDRLLHQ